jgi:hypothetical protein
MNIGGTRYIVVATRITPNDVEHLCISINDGVVSHIKWSNKDTVVCPLIYDEHKARLYPWPSFDAKANKAPTGLEKSSESDS